jgi:hypothetical protein
MSVTTVCEAHWNAHSNDCSGFVKAVAGELGVTLEGQANDIVDAIQEFPWATANDGADAASKALMGNLVIGGLKALTNGHVVIVVPGSIKDGKYPTAYWGSLGGIGMKNMTINWSWGAADRDRVVYGFYIGKSGVTMSAGRQR